jgi:formylglycine-generating enzyme required for sulfatase activity
MNIFIAFANQDRDVRDRLLSQMNLVKDRLGWHIWSAKEIKAGERWDEEIKRRLMDSEVVILLLSTDFFNSKYIIETELPKVVEKHRLGNCQIIPVIARVCHWKETAFGEYAELGDIQALPAGEKPLVSRGHWDNDDQPYYETVQGIRESIRAFQEKKRAAREATEARLRDEQAREARSRLKALKQQEAKQVAWPRYFVIGSSALAVAVVLWMVFGGSPKSDGLTSSQPITTPTQDILATQDTAKPAPISPLRQDTTAKNAPTQLAEQPAAAPPKPAFANPFEGQMVRVEGGTFMMGSPTTEQGGSEDECQHSVRVGTFYIGKYEVTQAQWKAVMGSNPSHHKGCNDCPVEQVSWDDVQVFVKKLNSLTGKKYRLPTEAEWEYAARGGGNSKGFTYAGSNTPGSVAWYSDNSGRETHPVGRKTPNELGLYDMSGNVFEWCQNIYEAYPMCVVTWRFRNHVRRGGCSFGVPTYCRIVDRGLYFKSEREAIIGFRLAQD